MDTTSVLSVPYGPHVGPMNFAIREASQASLAHLQGQMIVRERSRVGEFQVVLKSSKFIAIFDIYGDVYLQNLAIICV